MASEVIKLNLIPKGEMPVFHASQFDTGRLITCELYRGEDAYSVPEGYTVELHCRKVDNNIVTMASTLINDNVVTFTSTEQLTACNGNNLCEVAILDEGYRIGTLNFILEVEIDPLKGGITSTSEIHNLETQIEDITTEIVGENYYNKTEVDDLLDTKADASSVYTKTQVDSALALKANAADVYTKSQVDAELAYKADSSDVYTKTQTDTALALKANAADVYTKAETDAKIEEAIEGILPVDTAGPSAIASFTTGLALPLVDCKVGITATGGNGTPDNPIPIVGYSEANITANGNVITIAFGQTVYGGVLDVTRGKLHVTWRSVDLGALSWSYRNDTNPNAPYFYASTPSTPDNVKYKGAYYSTNYGLLCSIYSCVARGNFPNTDFTMCVDGSGDTPSQFQIKNSNYTDASSFTTAMDGVILVYELATPFDIDLTPEVISAIVGTNNVYTDTNGNTTVQYKDSIQHYIDTRV